MARTARFLFAVFLAALTATQPAYSAEREFIITSRLGLDSVAVFRGVKARKLNPSVFALGEMEYGEAYGGMFVTPVKFGSETRPLVLGYAGLAPSVFGVDFDFGARYFAFPDSRVLTIDLDGDGVADHAGRKGVFEGYGGVSKDFGHFEIGTIIHFTPDAFGETGDAYYAAASINAPLGAGFDLHGHYGRSEHSNDLLNDDYADYSVGVEKKLKGFDLALSYSDTAGLAGADNRAIIFSVSRKMTVYSESGRKSRKYDKILNNWVVDKRHFAIGAPAH